MERYRDGQKELQRVFVDPKKAYDKVPREEPWLCMRESGVAEKHVRLMRHMHESSMTEGECNVGVMDDFKEEVGLNQGLALSPFLFALVMDRMTHEFRQESLWMMLFPDDIVSREQVEDKEICASKKRKERQL